MKDHQKYHSSMSTNAYAVSSIVYSPIHTFSPSPRLLVLSVPSEIFVDRSRSNVLPWPLPPMMGSREMLVYD